jgi:phenylpropionate dioxygenase-like ring-hydroxylating dioxygenase large terminal subunit
MGQLMREYWIPACASAELVADGAPVRLMLLGEKLVAFRDSQGRVGILDHNCPHRCASLFFGRNMENGLRCIYHGWKFDVDGNCLDMPNVPKHQEFSAKIKAKAYRTFEHAGLVWTYMGARAEPPPLPALEVMFLPPDEIKVAMTQRECNWLQGLEGELDTSHFGFLHIGSVDLDNVDPTNLHRHAIKNRAPEYFMAETDWGTTYTAYRPADPGEIYYRFGHFLFPFWTLIPDGTFEDNIIAGAWVPMDDTHVMTTYMMWSKRTSALRTQKTGAAIPGFETIMAPLKPNTSDWFGRFRTQANAANDYLIDREAQRRNVYSGLTSIEVQDQAVVESMGDVVDRTKEHLAPSDRMITLTRRRLLRAVNAHHVENIVPPGVDAPDVFFGARGGSLIAPEGSDWLEVYGSRLKQATRASRTGVLRAAE